MTTRKWSALFMHNSMQKSIMQLIDNLTAQFKLVFAVGVLALSALVATPSAFAVGLGEITVKSALMSPSRPLFKLSIPAIFKIISFWCHWHRQRLLSGRG